MNDKQPEINIKDFVDFINLTEKEAIDSRYKLDDDKIVEMGVGFTSNSELYMIYKSENFEESINHNEHRSSIKKKVLDIIDKIEKNQTIDENHEMGQDSPLHICGQGTDECIRIDDFIKNKLKKLLENIEANSTDNPSKNIKEYLIGFYKPVHYYKESWGIYMIIDGITRAIINLKNYVKNYVKNNKLFLTKEISNEEGYYIQMAFTYFHEVYHHKIESLSIKFEMLYRKPFYTKGFHCLYCNTYGTDDCVEEAFANAYAYYRTIDFFKTKFEDFNIDFLKTILKEGIIQNSPEGYRMAYELVSGSENEKNKLEHHFLEILLQFSCKANGINYLPEMDVDFWKLFTYGLDPLVNKTNNVTYVVTATSMENEFFNNFFDNN